MPRARKKTVDRAVQAGCYICHNGRPRWNGKNAQGVAARHHDATDHQTWVRVDMRIIYGNAQANSLQAKLF